MSLMNFSTLMQSDNDRTSKIKKNILGTLVIKGIGIPTQLLLVPLTIGYISNELYGIWLTLTSIIGWISFFDIGFGNGLRNKLAEALAKGNVCVGKGYISTTYVCMTIIFVLIGIIGYYLVPLLDWCALLNTSLAYQQQIIDVMRIVVVCFCAQMVLKVQTSVWMGLQLNAIASLADAIGQLVTLIGIWMLTVTTFPSFTLMAWVFNGAPILILVLTTLYLFGFKRKDLCPSVGFVQSYYVRDIVGLGGKFFVIQIAAIVTFQVTNIILSNTSGPQSVTEYNVVYKYIGIANMVMNMILAPVWSAFTDAYVSADRLWMQRIYNRLKKIFYMICLLIAFMILVYPFVFNLWLGDKVDVRLEMVLVVAVFVVTQMWAGLHSVVINGIGKLKFALLYCNVQTVLSIPVCYYLGMQIGAIGVVLGTILITLPSMYFSPYQVVHLINGTAKGIWNK